MNFHMPIPDREPTREDAAEALELLRRWAAQSDPSDIDGLHPALARLAGAEAPAAYPDLARTYPGSFEATDAYRDTLPDLQNGPASLIRGARQQIQHVGISNFRLPIRFHTRDNGDL
ncbi:MAG: GTP cyclohydrolase I FolE2, partial [Rhodobacteraceae bacterium]|nr:GTP cyclohydrolase I FolE2 [Paracoccaceae bacterium]